MKNIYFKILFIAILGLTSCKSKQTIVSENGNITFDEKTFDPYFKGLGTEPFWNIEMDDHFIVYKNMEGMTEVLPIERIEKAQDANVQLIVSKNNQHQIRVTIAQQPCSDGMSDNSYDFKTEVELSGKEIKLTQNGCGNFIVPKKLRGKWELSYFKGNEIKDNQYLKTPYLEFESEEKQMSGNSSCNGISSQIYIERETLRFFSIAATKMMCVHENMESKFLKELPSVTKYKIEGNELHLFSNDALIMKFRKTTK